MKIFKIKCIVFAFFITQFAISQTFIVKPKTLNVRADTNKNSNVIAKMNENDTITAISIEDNWVKINISDKQGYVNKNYLEEITKNDNTKKEGFVYGFKSFFGISFIITILLLLGFKKIKKRVSDGRFSSGYKEYDISFGDYLINGIYALIIASSIGLISGIIYWIKTF